MKGCSHLENTSACLFKKMILHSLYLTFYLRLGFFPTNVDTVNVVTFEDAKNAVITQLISSDLEISVLSDFVVNNLLNMILQYIGMVPTNANSQFKKVDLAASLRSVYRETTLTLSWRTLIHSPWPTFSASFPTHGDSSPKAPPS